MTHDQFRIGKTFWCGGNQWVCIGIGGRVSHSTKQIMATRTIDGIGHTEAFDTFDMQGCSISPLHCPECQTVDGCERAGTCIEAANEP